MIVYYDFITGDELFTDTYPMKLIGQNKTIIEVQGKRITRSDKFDDSAIGANPSAEEAAEGVDESAVSGVNIVLNNRLTEIQEFKKAEYRDKVKAYIKGLLKKKEQKIAELESENCSKDAATMKEEVEYFKGKFMEDFKEVILSPYKEKAFQFFLGESLDDNGMISLMTYPEDDPEGKPIMYFIKFGLREEKV